MYKKRGRRVGRKRMGRRRIMRRGRVAGAMGITWTKKKLVSSVTASGGAQAMEYKLQDCPDNAIFAGLYDQYKITGVKVQIFPQEIVNQYTGGSSGNFVVPTITYSIDHNDNNTSWSEADLLQRENVKTRLFNKPLSIFIKPKPLLIDGGATATTFLQPSKRSFWLATHDIDDNIDQTPYYGLKFIVSNGGGSSQQSFYRVVTTYYVAFKQGRTKTT